MKLTKIVATLGPSSDSEENIKALMLAGVNVFRFNFKHGEVAWHTKRVHRVREIAKKLDIPVATMMDLQGPSFRIILPEPQIEIKHGDEFVFGSEQFTLTHPYIIPLLHKGQKLLIDDGTITFVVKEKPSKSTVKIVSHTNGILKTRKSLNIPGADFPVDLFTERDMEGVAIAVKEKMDWVAFSFARTAQDIKDVRATLVKKGYKGPIIAKLETQQSLDNLEEIVKLTDAVMVARGDLAVESPIEQVPLHQKRMIDLCLKYNKPVITATQMLASMERNPFPTRAEVSDVANAIYDRTDAVMLSGESAAGAYPVETVNLMAKICEFHEQKGNKYMLPNTHMDLIDRPCRIAHAGYKVYQDFVTTNMKVAAFVVFTHSGRTARLVSHFRPDVPVYAFTPWSEIVGQLALTYGVYPVQHPEPRASEVEKDHVRRAIDVLIQSKKLKKGDTIIVLHGDKWGARGGTSTVRIVEV